MNSPFRTFLSLLVLGFIVTGIYFGAVKGLNIYNIMEKSAMKKQISVKPENIKEKQVLVDPRSFDKDEFTFFDTLDDPSMSKFIGLNEKVIEPQKTTNKISNLAPETKKINILRSDIVNAKKSLNSVAYKIETREQSEPLASGFVLQVGAFKTLERAILLKNNLNKKGYSAFVTVARMSDAGEILHRVVIGSFTERKFAVKTAIRVKQLENLDSVIKWQEGPKSTDSP